MGCAPMIEEGDVLIRSLDSTYLVLDAVSHRALDGPFDAFADALAAALAFVRPGRTVWQENTDNRGRPLGPPMRIV